MLMFCCFQVEDLFQKVSGVAREGLLHTCRNFGADRMAQAASVTSSDAPAAYLLSFLMQDLGRVEGKSNQNQ